MYVNMALLIKSNTELKCPPDLAHQTNERVTSLRQLQYTRNMLNKVVSTHEIKHFVSVRDRIYAQISKSNTFIRSVAEINAVNLIRIERVSGARPTTKVYSFCLK